MEKKLAYLALLISLAAVVIAIAAYIDSPDQTGRGAMEEREEALIEYFKPKLHEMYKAMKLEFKEQPKRIEDLFDPMFALLQTIEK